MSGGADSTSAPGLLGGSRSCTTRVVFGLQQAFHRNTVGQLCAATAEGDDVSDATSPQSWHNVLTY